MLKKYDIDAFRKTVLEDESYKELIEAVKKDYCKCTENPIPALNYSKRWLFYKTGDRVSFETPYFEAIRLMSSSAMLAILYPENEEYITTLQDVMWAICDQYSWALPAHTSGKLEEDLTFIDLFAAESAYSLAEISFILEDRLEKSVLDRVRYEIKRRITDSFFNKEFAWENFRSNWAAVCAGGVGAAMMYTDTAAFEKALPRLLHACEVFVESYPEDGICLEGQSYWIYGFGCFVWFADLLFEYSDGKIDLFNSPKIERMAAYMQRTFMRGKTAVSFSDASINGRAHKPLQKYLFKKYPDTVLLIPDELSQDSAGCGFFQILLRAFLYAEPQLRCDELIFKDFFSGESGLAIIHKDKYSLAIKAGHNGEPHNHNDVGHFIISDDDGQVFCDLGSGLYTKQYFAAETRYDVFCNSSYSHSIPMLDGVGQKVGEEYHGDISYDGELITIEMAAAYGDERLKSLVRCIATKDDGITLTDTFECDGAKITERFVTLYTPKICGTYVKVGKWEMSFNPDVAEPSINVAIHEVHDVGNPPIPVYCIDFVVKNINSVSFKMRYVGE